MFELHQTEYSAQGLDFQQQVESRLNRYMGREGFPDLVARGLTREALTDYLFDYQAILDSGGSPKTRMIIAGFCLVLPLLVLSAFPEKSLPWGRWTVLVGILMGTVLFGLYTGCRQLYIHWATRRLRHRFVEMAQFVDDVLNFSLETI